MGGERAACELADWVSIRELTARYNRSVDDGDVEAFAAVFTDDGVLEVLGGPGGPRRRVGRAEIGSIAANAGPRELVHVTTDAIVEVDGDEATQLCTLLLCRRAPAKGVVVFTTGRYTDRLVRTPEGWRFAERSVFLDAANEGRMTLRSTRQ